MKTQTFILAALFFFGCIIPAVISHIRSTAKKDVVKNSVALKMVTQLASKYSFHPLPQTNYDIKYQKNLSSFRRLDYKQELLNFVKLNQLDLNEQIRKANENKRNYENYIYEYNYICSIHKTKWKSHLKERVENELLYQNKLSPVCSVSVTIENNYSSPRGQSRHHDSHIFSQEDILDAFEKIEKLSTFDAIKNEERSKMNSSLRYDILKRDGFKCVICGASASENITLHVDHIIPISKGGKTVKSNLRTLCSECNLGKRDKYDPYGIN